MQRISTLTKALDLFGLGKHGFKNGDLATGILPTDLDAAWFNGIQEEVVAVIEAAGIAPSGASLAQLLLALRSAGVFQTQATNDSSTKVATTAFANPGSSLSANGYKPLPGGLILQWGTVNATVAGAAVTYAMTYPTAGYITLLGNNNDIGITTAALSLTLSGFVAKASAPAAYNYISLGC